MSNCPGYFRFRITDGVRIPTVFGQKVRSSAFSEVMKYFLTTYFLAKQILVSSILAGIFVFGILAGMLSGTLSGTLYAQVGEGSATLPPEPAPPGASSLGYQDPYQAPMNSSRPLLSNPPSNPFNSLNLTRADGSTKLFQNWGMDVTLITPKGSSNNMGLFRFDVHGNIAIPLFASQENPLLLEPRFAMNFWNGPISGTYDMPGRTYDASLGVRWLPKFQLASMATALDFDLFFSIGVYSDFHKATAKSFRFPSWGYVSFDVTNNIKAKIGVWYLDRVNHKIFPSGGVIWTPNEQWEFQILFPNPRVTYRPAGATLRDMALYARGEYGGGSWAVAHEYGGTQRTDYNDYRLMFGMEWHGRANGKGFFEIGVAFAREIYIADERHGKDLNAGFILQSGFNF